MKTLLLDLETAPLTVHAWGIWQQNIGINQIMDSGYVLCWSAKWLGEDTIFFDSVYANHPVEMMKGIHTLLDEADAVIHYNGTKFDIPTLNKEFLEHGMNPPSPYKQIDLLRTARQQFRFPSNKLDYVVQRLGLGKKIKHRGHELWIGCMNNNADAWKEMEEYNRNDVVILEKLYYKLLPWIKGHPNHGLYQENPRVCPTCGGTHYQSRGVCRTQSGVYQRYQCQSCGRWFKDAAVQKNNQGPKASERFSDA